MDLTSVSGVSNIVAASGVNAGTTSAPSEATEDRRALIQAVRAVNAAELFGSENELSFAFDRKTRQAIVRIVDRKVDKEAGTCSSTAVIPRRNLFPTPPNPDAKIAAPQ